MSFQIICVLSLLVVGAVSQGVAGGGEFVPTGEGYLYEAGYEQSGGDGQINYYYSSYAIPTTSVSAWKGEEKLSYIAWASRNAVCDPTVTPTTTCTYEYVVAWNPACKTGAGEGGCGIAAYEINTSDLPTTWREVRVTRPDDFILNRSYKPISIDIGNEINWYGTVDGTSTGTFQAGIADFWSTLWYVDGSGVAYQMQCTSSQLGGHSDQFQPALRTQSNADSFVGCQAQWASPSPWTRAYPMDTSVHPATAKWTAPQAGSSNTPFALWHVSSGGRRNLASTGYASQVGCNVALIDNQNSRAASVSGASNIGQIWWGAWGTTSTNGACGNAWVSVIDSSSGSAVNGVFIGAATGIDYIWGVRDNGDGTTTVKYTTIEGVSTLPNFSTWTAAPAINAVYIDTFSIGRTFVIDTNGYIYQYTAGSPASWTSILDNTNNDGWTASKISVGPTSVYATLNHSGAQKQFRFDL